MPQESLDAAQPLLDRGELEIAGELLVEPASSIIWSTCSSGRRTGIDCTSWTRPEPSICIEYSRDPRYI
jgi:hypothetical protein